MDLLKIIQATGQQDKIVNALAGQFGLEGGQAGDVMGQVLGALGGGVQQNAQSEGGLGALMGILGQGNAEQIADAPEEIANQADAVTNEGNQILGQLMGSKDASRAAAGQIAEQSGVDASVIKQMMPMIATMAMGAMTKKAGGVQALAGDATQGGALGGLMGMLDMDGDGSPVDDIMGLMGKIASK